MCTIDVTHCQRLTQLTFIVTFCELTLASATLGDPVFIEYLLCAGTVLDPGKPRKISLCFFPPGTHEQFSPEGELYFGVYIPALPLVSCQVLGKSRHLSDVIECLVQCLADNKQLIDSGCGCFVISWPSRPWAVNSAPLSMPPTG